MCKAGLSAGCHGCVTFFLEHVRSSKGIGCHLLKRTFIANVRQLWDTPSNIATIATILSITTQANNMDENNDDLVRQIFDNARFVQSLGMELISFGKGWCETRVQVVPVLKQQHGFVHAGVVMTLADHTCGGAAATTAPAGHDVITVENKVSFLRPASGSVLFCRAQVLRAGKSLVFVEAEVAVERATERVLVAKASSTLAVIPLKAS